MKAVEDKEDTFEDYDEDEIVHLARRILKVWINRKKKKGFVPKKDKKGKAKQDDVICFECKEPRHVRSECPRLKKKLKKKAMIATWEDLDEEQQGLESQEEEVVANLCFMANIVSKKEIKVLDSEPELSYNDLIKAYDELLDDSQMLASHYALLNKNFQKLSCEFEKLKDKNEKLGRINTELSKENSLLHKDVTVLKTKASEISQNTSSNVSEL